MMDGSSHDQISFLFGDNLSNSDKNMSPFLFADDSGPGTGSEDGGDLPDEPVRPVQQRSGSKRSRAAEVHNLSEKRRRSRINEKMKALQNLIPNSNKTDKASMLDEAIEYLKQLQLQVQMLSMRNGLTSLPMYLPGGLQPLQAPQLCMSFGDSSTAMNMGALGMLPLNQDPSTHNSFDLTTHCASSHQNVLLATANVSAPETSFPLEPSQPHIRSFQLRVPDEEIFTEGMGVQKQLESGKTKGSLSENAVKTVNVASSFQFRRQASSSPLEHNNPLESALPKDLQDGIFSHQFDGLQPEGSFTKDDVKSVKLDI